MPLLWTYLLKRFFQIFLLTITSFIAVLLLLRLQEIVRFATMTSHPGKVALFSLYQIPYILPLALPISALIASFILMQSLSRSSELTALRASGLSMGKMLSPLLFCGAFLSLLGLIITSELTPGCRLRSKEMIYETTTSNPLLLLQKAKFMRLKESTAEIEMLDRDKKARNLFFIFRDMSEGRLSMICAKKLELKKNKLKGRDISLVTTMTADREDYFDQLIIENQKIMVLGDDFLANLIKTEMKAPHSEFLPFKWMLIKNELERGVDLKTHRRTCVEMARRFSLAFACLTFIAIGTCFGVEIGRLKRKKNLIYAVLCASFFLIAFTCGKSFHKSAWKASLSYLLPHPIVLSFCSVYSYKKKRGCE